MKKLSKLIVLLSVAAIPLAAWSATPDKPANTNPAKPAASLDALFGDAVVAKGKGVEVKRNDLDAMVVKSKAMAAARNIPVPADIEQEALKSMIIQQLFLSKATDAERAKGKQEFEDSLAKAKAANKWTDEDLNKRIDMQLFGGETREQWTKQQTDIATIPFVLERELNVHITDDDVKKFYDDPANISSFEQPEQVHAAHILLFTINPDTHEPLSAEKKAEKHKLMEDILKQARAGTNFAELAKKYSEDPGSKDSGGEYTFAHDGHMVKPFEDAAFALNKPGEISDIIESEFGYHIIKLIEKIPAKKVEFDKVKEPIHNHLLQLAIQKQLPDYVKKLAKAADIQILDDKLKNVDISIEPPAAGAPATAGPAPAPTTTK